MNHERPPGVENVSERGQGGRPKRGGAAKARVDYQNIVRSKSASARAKGDPDVGEEKVKRNDPCPCGKTNSEGVPVKFKRCCLGKQATTRYEAPGARPRRIKPLIPNLELLILKEPQREAMREACAFNAKLMDLVRDQIRPGARPAAIDDFVRTFTQDHGHVPAPLGYNPSGRKHGGFPASCCISPNGVVCHGIPDNTDQLREGDLVNVDLTTIVRGWHGDQSETFMVGGSQGPDRRLVQAAFDAMWAAIDALEPNCRVSVIGEAIEEVAGRTGYSIVEAFTGHGVGLHFHNDLAIPHYVTQPALLTRLPPGITFTIEPMINAGLKDVVLEADGWTVNTADGGRSAQFEHTILMTEQGAEVLTGTLLGPQRGHRF